MTDRVLIVDDEHNVRRMIAALLQQESYEVHDLAGGRELGDALASFAPDVVLMDLVMPPGPDGLKSLELIQRQSPETVVIMMSGKATLDDAVRATRLGAFQFLEKPFTPEGVLVAVRAGCDLARTRTENLVLRAAITPNHEMIGSSKGIEDVRILIDQVGATPSRVLVTGESGTGKELVARAIHSKSGRGARPLVTVNCAAIPTELIESELFGHERGAFTGATKRRRGRFELADKGTLFLDEVGDLPLDAQAKLLRVLEAGTIERVGGEDPVAVDVRVIAATNADLASRASERTFRQDLFYRLNVFPIHVPPLRKRREDIPQLIRHLASRAAAQLGRPVATFTSAALERLAAHSWPGNVRELANIVERLAIVTTGPSISTQKVEGALGTPSPPGYTLADPSQGLSDAMNSFERGTILEALEEAGGNISDTARRLATDRANLYRRMKRLGINHRDTPVSKRHAKAK